MVKQDRQPSFSFDVFKGINERGYGNGIRSPHDVMQRDQPVWLLRFPPVGQQTAPTADRFASDVERLRTLFDRFYGWKGEFAPHAMLGQLSRTERMRHAYLHMDHHLRQFGA